MAGVNGRFEFKRRTFLLGAASLSTFGAPRVSAKLQSRMDRRRTAVEGAFAPEVPDNPDDAFLVSTHGTPPLVESRGWETTDRETLTASLLELAPDILSVQDLTGFSGPPMDATYAHRHTVIGQFAYRWGLPHSSGFTRILEADGVNQAWYQDRQPDERWTKPDGTTVDHPMELAARTIDGEAHLWATGTSSIIPSVFAPGTLDYEASIGSQIYQLGANQLFVDGFELARLKGNDFSVWARTAFREHLDSLSPARLDELGIDDSASFDIRSYLDEHGVAPGQSQDNPAIDPVYREYTRRHHLQHKRYAQQLAERTVAGAPDTVDDAGTTFFGNQAGIAGPRAAPIYLSDAVDEIDIEVDPTLPPNRPHDVTVKTGLAAGRFEKPVRIEGKMHRIRAVDSLHGLDPEQQYPVLMQFQVAQAYAHGGLRGLSLSSWADVRERDVANNWIRPDGTIADALQQFIDFVRSNERFLHGLDPANDTVLVVSLPTLIWQRAPQWDRYIPSHSNAVRGAAAVLRRDHRPYDVVIFDYPPVWEAPSQLQRLQEYELVVIPGVESITDAQVEALEAAIDGGTSVVATGGAPDRDGEYRKRTDVRTFLEDDSNATVLEQNPERRGAGTGRRSFREALPDGDRQVELETDGDVSLNVMQSPGSGYVVVHLLNYEYDPGTDSMTKRSNLSVTVRNLSFEPVEATVHTASGRTEVDLDADGGAATVTVPQLDIWGFLVLKARPSAGAPETNRSTAAERVEEARTAIDSSEEDGRVVRLVQARAAMKDAERTLEYGGYDQASRSADAAIAASEAAYRRPVIGIDRAHHQSNELYDSDLGPLRDIFDAYDYRELDPWTDRGFGAIDVLIVPPILAEAGREYGFQASELAAVEAFVMEGGSLLLLGTHRPKPGFNRLARRFGFSLDGRPINKGRGDVWSFDVESPLSAVTAFTPGWGGRFGTTLATVEAGTVLGRVREGSPTWLTSEYPIDEQGSDEPTAAGEPVLAGRAYGSGHVVVSGEAWQFVDPTMPDGTPAPLPDQLLRTLGRRARYARRSREVATTPGESPAPGGTDSSTPTSRPGPSQTPNSVQTPAEQSSPAVTPSPGQRGFGYLAGVAGIVAGWWYRQRKS